MTRDFLTAQINRLARTLRRKLDPAAVDEYLRVLGGFAERTLVRVVDEILETATAETWFPTPGDLRAACRAHEPFAEQTRERPEPYRHLYERLPAECVKSLRGER